MLSRIEAYFMKEFSEKAGRLFVFSIFLLIPSYEVKGLFLFLLATSMLAWDIQQKRTTNMMALPYTLVELFVISWLFMITLISVTQFVGAAIPWDTSPDFILMTLVKSIIFATSYFSIAMIFVVSGLDNFGMPLLVLIGDWILASIGRSYQNFYWYVSPITQGNVFASAAFAFALFSLALYLFNKKGAAK